MTGDLVTLLHLCDSLFPLGAFAHSDGLEAATSRDQVREAGDLRAWMETLLHTTLRRSEALAVARAWRCAACGDGEGVARLDAEASALRPSSTGRDASRAMGVRLLKTWAALRPTPTLLTIVEGHPALSLPTAFGVVGATAGIGQRETVSGFLYTRLASTISAAMRLMALGQHDAHALLAATLAEVPSVADAVIDDAAPLGAFAPAFDIAAMRQQYGHSRLFRS